MRNLCFFRNYFQSVIRNGGYNWLRFDNGNNAGVNGINGGHELGHKIDHRLKMFLARILLTPLFQNHFITYHNGGHHRDVATPNDLTTTKKGDIFYFCIEITNWWAFQVLEIRGRKNKI